jgi:hypothetical protein
VSELACSLAKPAGGLRYDEHLADRVRQRSGVSGRDPDARDTVDDGPGHSADVRDHDRQSHRHRVDNGETESLFE